MLTNIILLGVLTFSTFASARSMAPKFCSRQELNKLSAVWTDMQNSGFQQEITNARIGMTAGDCMTPYSLQMIAERPHRQDAPAPYCAVIFTLSYDKSLAAKQAAWILDTVGGVYKTRNGVSIRLCAKVSTPRPYPGVTVHN